MPTRATTQSKHISFVCTRVYPHVRIFEHHHIEISLLHAPSLASEVSPYHPHPEKVHYLVRILKQQQYETSSYGFFGTSGNKSYTG